MPIFLRPIPGTEKCFMEQSIESKPFLTGDTVLRGEEYHFQLAYTTTEPGHDPKAILWLGHRWALRRIPDLFACHADLVPYQDEVSGASRQAVLSVVEDGIDPITFATYPHDDHYLPTMRSRVHQMIEVALDNGSIDR